MSEAEIDDQASYLAESFGIPLAAAREITKAVAAKQARRKKR
ncbi:MAG: hypothetical protein Q8M26_15140 [Pseudolabrys sp.]|nr:hypothetical protein [Pseudolabrys sp.]